MTELVSIVFYGKIPTVLAENFGAALTVITGKSHKLCRTVCL